MNNKSRSINQLSPGTKVQQQFCLFSFGSMLIGGSRFIQLHTNVCNAVALIFLSTLFACAPSRFVKPLDKGQQAVNLSLGGPLIEFGGLVIPTPLLTATYGKGFDSTLTGFASVHLTSALYGNAQVELGMVKRLRRQNGAAPGISITPVANLIYRNKDAKKFYPQLDLNAYWDFNRGRNFFYAGISNWFELSARRTLEQKQEHRWLLSPVVGQTFVRQRHNFTIEAKIIAPHIRYESSIVDYKSPLGKNGAFGIYFSYTKKF
jgi:hypothetical protein